MTPTKPYTKDATSILDIKHFTNDIYLYDAPTIDRLSLSKELYPSSKDFEEYLLNNSFMCNIQKIGKGHSLKHYTNIGHSLTQSIVQNFLDYHPKKQFGIIYDISNHTYYIANNLSDQLSQNLYIEIKTLFKNNSKIKLASTFSFCIDIL